MTPSPPREPLIAIVGATGTGKSQLAVSLAQRYNGEVINGDAMQLYEGLPIITNKIADEEQQGIPHHLLGCIGLHEQTWVVGTFVKNATRVIDEIRSREKLPILVGGTHYYTQSLLFKDRLAERDDEENERQFDANPKETWPVLQQPTETLLEELRKVDPIMADRWHPNDRRKIQRSLEIYLQTGKKASEIYAEQRELKSNSMQRNGEDEMITETPIMRFPTLLLWVHSEADTLRQRLDERVDKMLQSGLLEELETLDSAKAAEEADGRTVDETRGIWVSIGYKEFQAYSQAVKSADMSEKERKALKDEAIHRTKIATRQYAKRQVRWIRIKLVNGLAEAGMQSNLYLLDGSDVSSFDRAVIEPAYQLAQQFLSAAPMPDPSAMSEAASTMLTPRRDYDLAANPEKWTRQHCEICDVTCLTAEQWTAHTESKGHRKRASRERKRGGPRFKEP